MYKETIELPFSLYDTYTEMFRVFLHPEYGNLIQEFFPDPGSFEYD
jgi:hypothetical protein